VGSDTGLGIGGKYTLNYAVVPHGGDWRSASPWRNGLEFNNPLVVRSVAPHSGDLPAKWGLLEVSNDDAVTSALKPGKDGTVVLRIYEAAGEPSHSVRASWHASISQVHEANLIEDTGARLDAQGDSFAFDLKPYEIKTFKLTVRPAAIGSSQTARR
jgi:alpha-mannosidase